MEIGGLGEEDSDKFWGGATVLVDWGIGGRLKRMLGDLVASLQMAAALDAEAAWAASAMAMAVDACVQPSKSEGGKVSPTSIAALCVVLMVGDGVGAGGKRQRAAGVVEEVLVLVGFRREETAPADEPAGYVEGRRGTEGEGDILGGGWVFWEAAAATEEPVHGA